jgi:aminoglycoside 3-N-acetyltransferase
VATPSVTQSNIVSGLRTLGLKAGDVAFVHSSLSSFGHVEGGAEAVVRAFLEVLGPDGTLSVPIFNKYFTEGPDQVWDRDNTPSLMGRISETARTWPGARRSPHAVHPIAAIGRLAEDLTERYHVTDFAFDSPFARLLELDAWIVLIGVPFNNCTMVHLLEERAEIPYRHWVDRAGVVVENGVSTPRTFPFLQRHPGVGNDFLPLGDRLEKAGHVRIETIGKSVVRCFRSRDLYDTGMMALRQDPLFLVRAQDRAEARKYLPKYGERLDASPALPLWTPEDPVARRLSEVLRIPWPFASSPFFTAETTESAEEKKAEGGLTPVASCLTPIISASSARSAVNPVVEVRNRWETPDHLILEEFRLKGGPSPLIPGAIALPKGRPGPLPAVICLHGTGGAWEREMEQPFFRRGSTLIGWARELARRGFVAVAITQFSHPPRPEPWDWEGPKLLPACGRTGMGMLVSDLLLCVDYLSVRPEVDAKRIGVGGFSLGGIAAFYGFAVDRRVAACVTFCGGVGSVRRLIREGSTRYHSVYYYVPGLLSGHLDHPQLVSALAPRPLLVCGATEDVGMPLSGLRDFEAAARAVYRARGAEENFRLFVEEGPHALTMNAFETAAEWLLQEL